MEKEDGRVTGKQKIWRDGRTTYYFRGERERKRRRGHETTLRKIYCIREGRVWLEHASRGRVWAQMTRNKSNARRYTPPLLRTPFFSPYEAGTVLSAVAGRFPLGSRQSISRIRNAPACARKSPSAIDSQLFCDTS